VAGDVTLRALATAAQAAAAKITLRTAIEVQVNRRNV
jgi:hypothetical protein